MSLANRLQDAAAVPLPRHIRDAANEIDASVQAKLRPSGELVALIRSWIFNTERSNRYGK
jgi:hypothetical protein